VFKYYIQGKIILAAQIDLTKTWNKKQKIPHLPRKLRWKNVNSQTYYAIALHIIMVGIGDGVIPDNKKSNFL